uniref:Uncharacterized protein n=1 Tax=Anguilla anguilla TaxID=7936 RepID=A0A0E9V6A7_ANGAN
MNIKRDKIMTFVTGVILRVWSTSTPATPCCSALEFLWPKKTKVQPSSPGWATLNIENKAIWGK